MFLEQWKVKYNWKILYVRHCKVCILYVCMTYMFGAEGLINDNWHMHYIQDISRWGAKSVL